jgi:4,5-dihydroxyphthalate decarboxylase
MTREITIALDRYDRHFPFFDGTVEAPAGFSYRALQVGQSDILRDGTRRHEEMIHNQRFDVAEFSMSTFLMAIDRGVPLIGVPIFPRRLFSQSCMFVRADSDIESPADLIGKRVGTTQFSATAVVFMKGMLEHDYGVKQSQMHWFMGGLDKPTEVPLIPLDLPKDVRLDFVPEGDTLEKMLAEDRIDALVSIYIPPSFLARSPKITRLFPDYKAVEKDYYQRTGIFPIMHTLAMKRDVVEKNPWAAQSLYDAFKKARSLALDELYDTDALRVGLPWLLDSVEELWSVFGNDWWSYGVEENRRTLAALGTYIHEQGISPRIVTPEEMYVPGVK